jgi:hypothetical protein
MTKHGRDASTARKYIARASLARGARCRPCPASERLTSCHCSRYQRHGQGIRAGPAGTGAAFWGIEPASARCGRHPTCMQPTLLIDGALVHSPCMQSFPFHPHAFDIVLVPNALAQAEHCEREWTTQSARMASTRPKHEPRVSGWWHLMLELLRVLRPGPLGLLVLTGDASFELHLQEGLRSLRRAATGRTPSPSGTRRRPHEEVAVDSSGGVLGALNVSVLGCVTQGQFCACVLRSMGVRTRSPAA